MTTSTAQKPTLGIHTHLTSECQVFDRSGKLPFSIILGLCRRSPSDTDPRSLVFDIKGSALDVPYALANGLLTLRVQGTNGKAGDEVQVSSKPAVKGQTAYIILPSPVNRPKNTGNKFAEFITYSYLIDPSSELGALLKPGEKYSIGLASPELGLQLHSYGSHEKAVSVDSQSSEKTQYVNSKHSGSATFKVVKSLSWPPEVATHMQLRPDEAQSGATVLQISFTNTGSTPISVQCRGSQHYLSPNTLFSSAPPSEDRRARIIDSLESPWACLEIDDAKTGAVVHRHSDRPRICSLYDTTVDRRIKLSNLVTLMPGEPFIRRVNISERFATLPNGEFSIRLSARGVWWCSGTAEQISDEGDDRVPKRLHKTTIPPLQLKCDETAIVRVEDGQVVGQVS